MHLCSFPGSIYILRSSFFVTFFYSSLLCFALQFVIFRTFSMDDGKQNMHVEVCVRVCVCIYSHPNDVYVRIKLYNS